LPKLTCPTDKEALLADGRKNVGGRVRQIECFCPELQIDGLCEGSVLK
jgi:hypothetical protein